MRFLTIEDVYEQATGGALGVALAAAFVLALGCAPGFFRAPDGMRPSTITIYGEGGSSEGSSFGDEFDQRDRRGGIAVEFEFVYDEWVEEELDE